MAQNQDVSVTSDNNDLPPVSVSDNTNLPPINVSEPISTAPIETFIDETGEEITHAVRYGSGGGARKSQIKKTTTIKSEAKEEKDFCSKVFKVGGLELTPKHLAVSLTTGVGAFFLARKMATNPAVTVAYAFTGLLAGLTVGKLTLKNDC